jgi:hypothetical protein
LAVKVLGRADRLVRYSFTSRLRITRNLTDAFLHLAGSVSNRSFDAIFVHSRSPDDDDG